METAMATATDTECWKSGIRIMVRLSVL